jgi:hypothetical protein
MIRDQFDSPYFRSDGARRCFTLSMFCDELRSDGEESDHDCREIPAMLAKEWHFDRSRLNGPLNGIVPRE